MPIRPARLENVAAGVRDEEIRRVIGEDLVGISWIDRISARMSRIKHWGSGRCRVPNLEPEWGTAAQIAAAQVDEVTVARLNHPKHLLVEAVLATCRQPLDQENGAMHARIESYSPHRSLPETGPEVRTHILGVRPGRARGGGRLRKAAENR